MIIAGAGGHGLEVCHVLIQQGISTSEIYFFDEDPVKLQRGEIQGRGIFDLSEIQQHFSQDPRFILGVGNPIHREKLYHLLSALGGSVYGIGSVSTLESSKVFDAMPFSFIGPETSIGLGVLINTSAHVHHECTVGDFTEIGPGAMLLGAVKVGAKCSIGAGAVLLPGVELGEGVVVGAGAVVTKSVMQKSVLVGIPAKPVT
ncbi:PglD-related sugar-binding protein [Algoriphagus chordae]|uniref:Sugar O-acyltransferase (Sialic acid O-acetyltransferase NeuD family) n=1 Tax=Algoriphagus chordae TaxID=237019 RepID=A0A2W7QTH0_9BACT|nr:DapH/DapD/GlmU-related protein [Algoriphagus chordae]PZX51893.1 sugar O-acyltransferase (sialic acid O-acetyltransferase NeuD family) [Algoriphagus chordae]